MNIAFTLTKETWCAAHARVATAPVLLSGNPRFMIFIRYRFLAATSNAKLKCQTLVAPIQCVKLMSCGNFRAHAWNFYKFVILCERKRA